VTRKLTQKEFVKRARRVHGYLYDYSKSKYDGKSNLVEIICRKCKKSFWKSPANHFRGQGCPRCSARDRFSTRKQFISKSSMKHGKGSFDYSRVKYVDCNKKVEIGCLACGKWFFQKPRLHSYGKGCPHCCRNRRLTMDVFLKEARKIHGSSYEYLGIKGSGYKRKVYICCVMCGWHWYSSMSSHLCGKGCPQCSKIKLRLKQGEFEKRARNVHGDEYSYKHSIYTGMEAKVMIGCNSCGTEFYQTPNNHLKGCGCPRCAKGSVSKVGRRILDRIRVPVDLRETIVEGKKVDGYIPSLKRVYEVQGSYFHGNPDFYPAQNINRVNKKKFGDLYRKSEARTNSLVSLGFEVVELWVHSGHKGYLKVRHYRNGKLIVRFGKDAWNNLRILADQNLSTMKNGKNDT